MKKNLTPGRYPGQKKNKLKKRRHWRGLFVVL